MVQPVPASDARAALLKKGFRKVPYRDHEFFQYYDEDNRKTAFFMKISHGAAEVRRDEMKNTVRVHGLRTEDLFQILNCQADLERTREIWRQRPARENR